MTQWADFVGAPPGATALLKAGFTGVIRYIGVGGSFKRITAMEYEDYSRNGVHVALVAELGTDDAWAALDDYATGVARAQSAIADMRTLGIPDYVPVACAADAHASSAAQITDAVAYARGFASVVGTARAGFYGFAETLRAVHDAQVVSWHWLCGPAPSFGDSSWVNIWQRNDGTRTVNGVVCDVNEVLNPWEGHMSLTDDIIKEINDGFLAQWETDHGPLGDARNADTIGRLLAQGVTASLRTRDIMEELNAGAMDALGNPKDGSIRQWSSAVLTVLESLKTGGVDVNALAAALSPLIKAGATVDDVHAALASLTLKAQS